MHVCTCIYMYIHVCACTPVYIHVSTCMLYTCTYMYIQAHPCMSMYIHVYLCKIINPGIFMGIHGYLWIYMDTHGEYSKFFTSGCLRTVQLILEKCSFSAKKRRKQNVFKLESWGLVNGISIHISSPYNLSC